MIWVRRRPHLRIILPIRVKTHLLRRRPARVVPFPDNWVLEPIAWPSASLCLQNVLFKVSIISSKWDGIRVVNMTASTSYLVSFVASCALACESQWLCRIDWSLKCNVSKFTKLFLRFLFLPTSVFPVLFSSHYFLTLISLPLPLFPVLSLRRRRHRSLLLNFPLRHIRLQLLRKNSRASRASDGVFTRIVRCVFRGCCGPDTSA